MEKTIFHVDVNSAFLSWTAVKELKLGSSLDLRTVPSAIGGDEKVRHGIILAKSLLAKQYGIVTGEPIVSALKKCPSLVIVPPDYNLYSKNSNMLFTFLSYYSDRLEIFSIDECFIDYTGMERLWGNAENVATSIKEKIKKQFGFTVNIGIGPNKLLAKMAGEPGHADEINTIYAHEIKEKMWPLPVSKLFMVGKQTTAKLNHLGIFTIGQLATYDNNILEREFKSNGTVIKSHANGVADSYVAPIYHHHIYKSISSETTVPYDVTTKEGAYKVLLALSQNVAQRLRRKKMYANGISISIKTNTFKRYSKQISIKNSTDNTDVIYSTAVELFNIIWKKEPLLLLGLSADRLSENETSQISLDDNTNIKKQRAEQAMDKINNKFGRNTVTRCALLNSQIELTKRISFSKDDSDTLV